MSSLRRPLHGLWSGSAVFVLAVAGLAIGLGNFWRFPALAGNHGGGYFVLAYVVCMLMLGLPLLVAEVALGRRGRRSAALSLAEIAGEEGRHRIWQVFGWAGALAAVLLVSTYGVVGGWILGYIFRVAGGAFVHADPLEAADAFQSFVRDPERLLAWHTLFIAVVVMVVGRGVRWGLEEAVRWFMPMLLGILAVLVVYTVLEADWRFAVRELFWPAADELSLKTLGLALQQAFYSLSLGVGAVLCYGAYLDSKASIARVSIAAVVLDLAVALLAAVLIFAILAQSGGMGLAWHSGPELIFQALPLAFGQMSNGTWFGTLLFLMLAFAAWTSAIALLEPAVALLVERFELDRPTAASYLGLIVWALGLVSLLSFNLWEHVRPLGEWARFRDSTPFDLVNFMAANILLPVGGFGLAVFAGWRVSRMTLQLELGSGRMFGLWLISVRFLVPVAAVLVFLQGLGYLT